ncbi:protein lin-52 homolog isoform X2 [Osmia bicornis bicornis]|uniref:protein lin-52 homolog isoform X2 n=1 Tax=Osmia bicornis bicornis TaxID=1437191 RepID=UPI0010F9A7B2|nr:protein lin-52 homolog isoform X2 [Osmia bicornis bicornis]
MNVMTTEEPADQPDLICVEESLMSLEKLDRASPDLWPEQSVNEFVAQHSPQTEPSSWASGLTPDDINQLHQLGNLSMNGLISEVKKLHDMAYQLGLEEAKEMTRGCSLMGEQPPRAEFDRGREQTTIWLPPPQRLPSSSQHPVYNYFCFVKM